jgi:membrane-associated phospholipid phosphatase
MRPSLPTSRRFRWILPAIATLALAAPATATAGSFDARETLRSLRAESGWLDRDRVPLALPLPAPSFTSRLQWSLPAAVPTRPPRATLRGWVPSILLLGAFATVQLAFDPPAHSRWTDRNGFDSGIRRGLRGGSRGVREDAALASDVVFAGLGVALVGDWWWLRDEYGLLRSLQVDSRWLLANNLVTRIAKVGAGRQRPYVQPCGRDDDWVPACDSGREGKAGFFSGHASNAATLAGLLCARHLNRREAGPVDALVCGGAAAGALTAGVLRIVSEHHFATDILVGWVAGAFFGYYLPSRFEYLDRPGAAAALRAFAPVVGRDYYGFQVGFRF